MKLVSFEWCAQILFGKAGIHLHMKEQSQLVGSNTKEVNHGSMQGILESVPLSGWKKHMNWLKFGQDSFITQYVFKHLYCSIGTKNKKQKTKNKKQKTKNKKHNTKQNKTKQNKTKQNKTKKTALLFCYTARYIWSCNK